MVEIEDFILVADNVCTPDFCKHYINFFNIMAQRGQSLSRDASGRMMVDDNSVNLCQEDVTGDLNICNFTQRFDDFFWTNCYKPYADKYAILSAYAPHKIYSLKVQRTVPGEAYHVWHTENPKREYCNRLMAFILYLNDVEEGGETEFLYQHRRIKPKMGTCVLWPANYTHVHRGNPPLKGEKYILTGWVEM